MRIFTVNLLDFNLLYNFCYSSVGRVMVPLTSDHGFKSHRIQRRYFLKVRRRALSKLSDAFEYKQGFSPHLHPFTNLHRERRDRTLSGLVFSLVKMARDCALTHFATRLHLNLFIKLLYQFILFAEVRSMLNRFICLSLHQDKMGQ